ncbi:hypothetical protein DOY81_012500, partial [Sarcophaga bullata]
NHAKPYTCSLLIIGLFSITIKCEEFLECLNEEIEAFIPVADNCSKAIYCNGIQSTIVDCSEQYPYFSAKDKVCSDDIRVCNERFATVVPTITTNSRPTPTTTIGRPTSTTTTSRPPTPPRLSTTAVVTSTVTSTLKVESSTGFTTTSSAYASSSRPTPPVLPTVAVANTATTRNPSTILVASTAQVIATAAPTTDGLSCPLQDDPQRPLYLPHPQSCAKYYLCYHGTPMVMQCPNMLLFDVIQQSCNAVEFVNCQLSSISTPPRQCLPHMITVYPHPKNCNYYYRCEYGYLKVMQCPFGMGWDYEMAICTQLSQTKCYKPTQRYFM